ATPAWRRGPGRGTDASSAREFVRWAVGQIGPMTFARVDDGESTSASGVEHAHRWCQYRSSAGQGVAHTLDIPARTAEVGLPVDEHQRGVTRIDDAVIGPWVG